MDNDDLDKELLRLEQIHRAYKKSLNKRSKTRAWAVWLLIGAFLAVCHRVITCQKRGDVMGIFLIGRLAVEYSEQIRFFANPQTKITAIQDWWKIYNPSRHDTKLENIEYRLFSVDPNHRKMAQYIHTNTRPTPEGVDFSRTEDTKQLMRLLSLYAHPSYTITDMLFRSDSNHGKWETYDYKGQAMRHLDLAQHFASTILNIADHTIGMTEYLYGHKSTTDALIAIE